MRSLANLLRVRLAAISTAGVFIERIDLAPGTTDPLIAARGNDLLLAADAPALADLAAALALDLSAAHAGLDALAAHALTVLNAAHETVTDDVERAGLGHLLARPS